MVVPLQHILVYSIKHGYWSVGEEEIRARSSANSIDFLPHLSSGGNGFLKNHSGVGAVVTSSEASWERVQGRRRLNSLIYNHMADFSRILLMVEKIVMPLWLARMAKFVLTPLWDIEASTERWEGHSWTT